MPIGAFTTIPHLAKGILSTNPTTVLDLGIGFGMNGAVVRNWLDCGTQPYQAELTGVEIFGEYISPLWDLYDRVHISDIYKFLQDAVNNERNYDMVIMTDVIEHFDKDMGIKVLEMCKKVCNKAVMVSTPAIFIEQGAYASNVHETHLSHWSIQDFQQLGFGVVKDGKPDGFGHQMLVVDYIRK